MIFRKSTDQKIQCGRSRQTASADGANCGGKVLLGGGTPDTGGGTPFHLVPAEFTE